MPAVSPRLGEFLVKTTGAKDIDNAFEKVFADYLELKTKSLEEIAKSFRVKWGMDLEEFKKKVEAGALIKDSYSFDVERDFWEWEEAETLKKHYEILKSEWL